jgi:hypothetical protein
MIKFNFITSLRNKEPGKLFSMETRLGAGLPENVGSIPEGRGMCLFTTASKRTLGHTQLLIQWAPVLFPLE